MHDDIRPSSQLVDLKHRRRCLLLFAAVEVFSERAAGTRNTHLGFPLVVLLLSGTGVHEYSTLKLTNAGVFGWQAYQHYDNEYHSDGREYKLRLMLTSYIVQTAIIVLMSGSKRGLYFGSEFKRIFTPVRTKK